MNTLHSLSLLCGLRVACRFAVASCACIFTELIAFKVLPDHFADEEQAIWLPACFAIPWFLGQQVRHQRQVRQTEENGYQVRLKKPC